MNIIGDSRELSLARIHGFFYYGGLHDEAEHQVCIFHTRNQQVVEQWRGAGWLVTRHIALSLLQQEWILKLSGHIKDGLDCASYLDDWRLHWKFYWTGLLRLIVGL